MPHTNNPNAKARKANRHDPRKPAFLRRKAPAPLDDPATATATSPVSTPAPLPRAHHAAVIAEFHALEKQLAAAPDPLARRLVRQRQHALGGLAAYQAASIHGADKARGGESGKQCVAWIKDLKIGVDVDPVGPDAKGKRKAVPDLVVHDNGKITKVYPKLEREKLRLLDVGGITGTSYADWPWIDATYIDLHPQGPNVVQSDFFDYPVPAPDALYDVLGLSLVLNFVGSLSQRGEMLRRAHAFLKPTGFLFLVLPLPCLTNSRYMTHDRLRAILASTGWAPAKHRDSLKLTFWMLRRTAPAPDARTTWPREEVRSGVRRNNFCILVKPPGEHQDDDGDDEALSDSVDETEPPVDDDGDSGDEGDEEEWTGVTVPGDEEEWTGVQLDDEEEEWTGC